MTTTTTSPVRRVTVPLWRGLTITVECPAWCVLDHGQDPAQHPSDIYHWGKTEAVTGRPSDGSQVPGMYAHLMQTPFDPRHNRPVMAVALGGQDTQDYALPALDQLLADLEDFVPRLRALRDQLAGLEHGGGR